MTMLFIGSLLTILISAVLYSAHISIRNKSLEIGSLDLPIKLIPPRIFYIDYLKYLKPNVSQRDMRDAIDKYFLYIKNEIKKSKSKITVLDYFEHTHEIEDTGAFYERLRDGYRDYYRTIETTVKGNSEISYTRILQLPLGAPSDFGSSAQLYRYALKVIDIYSPLWEHIVNMRNCNNFFMYVINVPLRTPSEMIIDNSVWFFESDRYNKGAKITPDLLFLNRAEESEMLKMQY